MEPHFIKGGKFHTFYPIFEMLETGHFTPGKVTSGKTHIRDFLDSKRLMITVVLALLPCVFMAIYNTGYQRGIALGQNIAHLEIFFTGISIFIPIYLVTMTVGAFWEILFAVIRRHEVNEGFLVTGLIFPLILPPSIPLWQVILAVSVGIVIGKEIFGGVGMNIVNPALLGRAFLFFSYPGNISGEFIWYSINTTKEQIVDAISSATPLGIAAATEGNANIIYALNNAGYGFKNLFIGLVPGSIGETSTIACLLGAAILIFTKIASYRTMLGIVIGAIITSLIFNIIGSNTNPLFSLPPHYHLVMGGFAFGTVFMATDPVTSAATAIGKWIYGLMIGSIAIIIRVLNPAYPEGMMLAILLMNVFAPTIDHFVAQANIKRRLKRGKK